MAYGRLFLSHMTICKASRQIWLKLTNERNLSLTKSLYRLVRSAGSAPPSIIGFLRTSLWIPAVFWLTF